MHKKLQREAALAMSFVDGLDPWVVPKGKGAEVEIARSVGSPK
jgi:hypothetical protein